MSDVGPVPMNVAALLVLGPRPDGVQPDPDLIEDALVARLARVPRLRQRLAGTHAWVPDDGDPRDLVTRVRCPAPGDRRALLDLAAGLATDPLPRDRPLGRAVVVTGLADGSGALAVVVVLHHVLSDGVGGLALLAGLADDPVPVAATRSSADPGQPGASPPSRAPLGRARGLRARLADARTEIGAIRPPSAPRTSLNRPTGPRRRLATVTVPLGTVTGAAHRAGATVNDVLLVAVTGALAALLRARGEPVRRLVVSVPVSARRATTSSDLGNRTGVMPVVVDVTGGPSERLAAVAATTRPRRTGQRGASAALFQPVWRALAATGLLRWFVEHQRLVNTFLSNLAGPRARLALAGWPVVEVLPVTTTPGNIGVNVCALSYAGDLTVVLVADPDLVPDLDRLAQTLAAELAALGAG
jgi:WS/DGAT/MGAT family acyltransferase